MPKLPTFPTLYNKVLQLEISELKKWGYLEPESCTRGTLTSNKTNATFSIQAKIYSGKAFIELKYIYRSRLRHYQIELTSIPSNLGKGRVWYFKCPLTKKRSRKLYFIDGYFLHREAFQGCMYECQTKSKKRRQFERLLTTFFQVDQPYEQLNQKHFKRMYAGKPTKKYLRLQREVENNKSVAPDKIEQLARRLR